MKILISGTGPAGLTVAYWLKRYGFASTYKYFYIMIVRNFHNIINV